MARGINSCTYIGNLGKDPDTRYTAGDNSICITSCRLAVTTKRGQDDNTFWVTVKFFGKLGEIAGKYLKKGSTVYVRGRMSNNDWEKNGVQHRDVELLVDEMQMLDKRESNAGVPASTTRNPAELGGDMANHTAGSQPIYDDEGPVF